jgi:hypothetical protein
MGNGYGLHNQAGCYVLGRKEKVEEGMGASPDARGLKLGLPLLLVHLLEDILEPGR